MNEMFYEERKQSIYSKATKFIMKKETKNKMRHFKEKNKS